MYKGCALSSWGLLRLFWRWAGGSRLLPGLGGRTRTETGGPVLLGGTLLSQKYKNITKLIKD